MSEFSKLLDMYIERSGLTEAQLAKSVGFSRSYIALLRNGQRVPADAEKMQELIRRLHLMLHEQDHLWERYLMERYGAQNYLAMKQLFEILQMIGKPPALSYRSSCLYADVKGLNVITGRADIEGYIKVILSDAVLNQVPVQIFMAEELIFECLSACYHRDIKIEHIVGIGADDTGALESVEMLGKVLQTKILGMTGYTAWHFNAGSAHQCNAWALMPYCIITADRVINIAGDVESAYVSDDIHMITMYQQQFDVLKHRCDILVTDDAKMSGSISAGEDVVSIGWPRSFRKSDGKINIAEMLKARTGSVYTLYLTRAMVRNVLNTVDKETAGALPDILRNDRVNIYILSDTCSISPDVYLTLYGLKRLELGSDCMGPYVLESQPLIQTIHSLLGKLSTSSYVKSLSCLNDLEGML